MSHITHWLQKMSLHLLYNIYYVSKADKHKLGKEMLEKKNPIETSLVFHTNDLFCCNNESHYAFSYLFQYFQFLNHYIAFFLFSFFNYLTLGLLVG